MNARLRTPAGYTWWIDIFFILISLGCLFFIFLGRNPLFVPDEGRYAEIAREMVASNNYVTPYLNGIKYFEKPILFYWLCAAAIKLVGLKLWSLRSVNATLALLGCLFTYLTCRTLYNRQTGLLAAFILATSTLYFVMAHMISLDLTVTFFLSTSLYAFLLGIHTLHANHRKYFLWAAFACAGCAVLTKGLIGILFPVMIVGTWMAVTSQWRLLSKLYLPSSICVFLIVVMPWHIQVIQANPEFFHFYFIEQHFLRYTTTEVGHYQPAWFFIPVLIASFFPWIIFLPQACIHAIKYRNVSDFHIERFLLLWATLIFIFFSFSKSKLIPYILPVIPALAILTAKYLNDMLLQPQQKMRLPLLVFIVFASIISFVFHVFPRQTPLPDPLTAKILLTFASCCLFLIILDYWLVYADIKKWLILLISNTFVFLLLLLAVLPAIDTRTISPLATILRTRLNPQDEVITFNQYYQDLPFYLDRVVSVLNWRNELRFGMQHQSNIDRLLKDEDFWEHWFSSKTVYFIASTSEFEQLKKKHPTENFHLIAQTLTNVLVTNHVSNQSA